jgi:hypothetical protein
MRDLPCLHASLWTDWLFAADLSEISVELKSTKIFGAWEALVDAERALETLHIDESVSHELPNTI